MKEIPTGTKADKEAAVDISKVHGGYFSNPENAKTFNKIGIESLELPHHIKYYDFGGGEGYLSDTVKKYLIDHGHEVDATVLDANEIYLVKAQEKGLQILHSSIEDSNVANADLITMRAVNHYNPIEQQKLLLQRTRESLKSGGYFVSQVSSGSKGNCELRSEIVNLTSLGRAATGEEYHWTNEDEYIQLLQEAGFSKIQKVGEAASNAWGPEEQWDRFHTKELQETQSRNDTVALEAIELRRQKFLQETHAILKKYLAQYSTEELGIENTETGSYIIHYTYPIIVARV